MNQTRHSAVQWGTWVAQQEASGLPVAAFCARRGLKTVTFYAWRQRLARANRAAGFVEVTPPGPVEAAMKDAAAAGVSVAGAGAFPGAFPGVFPGVFPEAGVLSGVELVLSGGVVARVRAGFDATVLRQVVEALR